MRPNAPRRQHDLREVCIPCTGWCGLRRHRLSADQRPDVGSKGCPPGLSKSSAGLRPGSSKSSVLARREKTMQQGSTIKKHRIYTISFARVYPEYVAKAEKKGRTKAEVDEIIRWLTGYSQEAFEAQLEKQTDMETFFAEAPQPNPSRALIKGVIWGIRVEEIEEPTMREIRYLDKLIDELANGKAKEKILRKP